MKLAASQIGWAQEEMEPALSILQKNGFTGLEIAPTMVAGETPYSSPQKGAEYARWVGEKYGLEICSMQSLWYGQSGSMFGAERAKLLKTTKQAALFAKAVGAGNMVFGNPKNRVLPEGMPDDSAIAFFKEAGDFAAANGTVLALEANPTLYGTNYMNTTAEAFSTAQRVGSKGCFVNLDFGTMLINNESIEALQGNLAMVSHVHISEPQLALLQPHARHRQLAALLRQGGYAGYVSIEMKQQPLEEWERTAAYIAEVFG